MASPIAHGDPGSAAAAVRELLRALAVGQPDRVDRRQVDDVEAELGELGQLALDPLQPAPGAREQLIPGAEPRPQAVDLDRTRLIERDAVTAIGAALDGRVQLLAERDVVLGAVGDLGVLELAVGVLDQRSLRL